jgi:hypothetical protein
MLSSWDHSLIVVFVGENVCILGFHSVVVITLA